MLVKEAGPYHVFADLRYTTGIEYNDDGSVLTYPDWNPLVCVLCSSIYTAVLVLLMPGWLRKVFAVSGVAVLLEGQGRDE